MPPPQKKGSLTWLWITLGIVGGVLILSCVACGVIGYNIAKQATNLAGPSITATQYYTYMRAQDYNKAYSFVDPNATFTVGGQSIPVTDQQSFTTAAQTFDQSLGTISNVVVQPSTSTTSNVTVTVTRGGKSYDVHLTMQQVANSWKIVSADGI
jgi:hypothetical protein